MKKAHSFGVLAGNNVMLSGSATAETHGIADVAGVWPKIRALMARYDGKRPLPRGSGNRGDRPEAHHYSKWLFGLKAYTFASEGRRRTAFADIEAGNREVRRRRANARKKLKRG